MKKRILATAMVIGMAVSAFGSDLENKVEESIPEEQQQEQQQPQEELLSATPYTIFNNYIPSMDSSVQWYKIVTKDFEGDQAISMYTMIIYTRKGNYLITDVRSGRENLVDKVEIIDATGRHSARNQQEFNFGQILYNKARVEILSPSLDGFYSQNPPQPLPEKKKELKPDSNSHGSKGGPYKKDVKLISDT